MAANNHILILKRSDSISYLLGDRENGLKPKLNDHWSFLRLIFKQNWIKRRFTEYLFLIDSSLRI